MAARCHRYTLTVRILPLLFGKLYRRRLVEAMACTLHIIQQRAGLFWRVHGSHVLGHLQPLSARDGLTLKPTRLLLLLIFFVFGPRTCQANFSLVHGSTRVTLALRAALMIRIRRGHATFGCVIFAVEQFGAPVR